MLMWRAAAASCLPLIKNPRGAPRRSSTSAARRPDVLGAARCIINRDLLLALRRRSDVATTLLFFVIVTSLFPLGIGAERDLLRSMAPGVIWVAALLSCMLSLGPLFAAVP